MIYLDSAATTLQKPPEVARASAWAIGHLASPGRGGHRPAMAGRCPPRPGLARWPMAQALARATSGGFCSVVAALSR